MITMDQGVMSNEQGMHDVEEQGGNKISNIFVPELNSQINSNIYWKKSMGNTNIQNVESRLEQDYKSLRKYYDDFYGEITLIQDKNAMSLFARVDKIMHNNHKNVKEYLELRKKHSHKIFLPLAFYYSSKVDLCSETETYIFLLQYSSHTLFKQIIKRQKQEKPFTIEELIQIYTTVIQCQSYLKATHSKQIPSNSSYIYKSPSDLQILEPILYNKRESNEMDFCQVQSYEELLSRDLYISPESFVLLCRRENFKAKEMSLCEESLVFTVGMNFIECALLSDLSELYDHKNKVFNNDKLLIAVAEIGELFGEEIEKLVESLTVNPPQKRPSLNQIKEYLKIISRSRQMRLQQSKTPQFIDFFSKRNSYNNTHSSNNKPPLPYK